MEYVVGISLALAVSLLASVVGFERDRAFYPTVMIVIASYYDLFAIIGGSVAALGLELVVFAAFLLVSVIGFKTNLWLVAGALFAHGVFDFSHDRLISNPGVPAWWPGFCLSYDIVAAIYLAWLLSRSTIAVNDRIKKERPGAI
jgi:hypothetical protein